MLDLLPEHRLVADRLAGELEQVSIIFERQLASELSAVNALCVHVEHYRGKMLRPALVLLSGMVCESSPAAGAAPPDAATPAETLRTVAAVVEMIHMATLVHDDVLDEADVRRRGATINHLWGNEAAVMLGDYLISNAFHLCSTLGDPTVNLALGEVTNTLCEGELMQLHHRDDYSVSEETYLEIVRRKTASLIGECCRLGPRLAGADDHLVAALHRYGTALGIAFQIQDDLLDLIGEAEVVGKTLGRDLEKGKLTLPVIHNLSRADHRQRGETIRLLQQGRPSELRARLEETGSVQHTRAAARRFADQARAELPRLPDTPPRSLLEHFAETVVSRTF